VLVERVEGFASEHEYRRGYSEINHFEEQLTAHGILMVKFWIHITKDEQLRRFRDRRRTEHKRWKITPEDWRNRGRWGAYTQAVNEMVERTSTRVTPWTLVEGNDKNFARIKVLKTVADRMEQRLKRS
jgi:polyphosphate kinase 2 (PPK2 family)